MRRRARVGAGLIIAGFAAGLYPKPAYSGVSNLTRSRNLVDAALTPDGFVELLRAEETDRILAALFQYSRYRNHPFVELPAGVRLARGTFARRTAYEAELKTTAPSSWRRSLWLAELETYSEALVRIDFALDRAYGTDAETLRKERSKILDLEPLLNRKVAPLKKRVLGFEIDEPYPREIYVYIHKVFRSIPSESFRCAANGTDPCLFRSVTGINPTLVANIRESLIREREWVESIGRDALANLLEEFRVRIARGTPSVPISVLERDLSDFPGGPDRFFQLIEELNEMSDDERLERRLREKLVATILEPALTDVVESLRSDLTLVQARPYRAYADLSEFRAQVIESMPASWRPIASKIDRELLNESRRHDRMKIVRDIAVPATVTASLLISPPSAGIAMFADSWVWTRLAVSGAHAFSYARDAKERTNLESSRVVSGLAGLETLRLAESRFRLTALLAFLEILAPLRIGPSVKPTVDRLVTSLRESGWNPWSRNHLLRISTGNGREIFSVQHRIFGPVLFRKMSSDTIRALGEARQIARSVLTGQGSTAWRALQQSTIRGATFNATASVGIMVVTEGISRGPLFLSDPGTYRNLIITGLEDFALGFFGLGSYTTLEKLIAVGGTVWTMSIVGQLVSMAMAGQFSTGLRHPTPLVRRGLAEALYVDGFSFWKLGLADELARGMGPGGTWAVFVLNNGIGNSLYSVGTKHLFEHDEPPNLSRWWPEGEEPATIVSRPRRADPYRSARKPFRATPAAAP